jgi:hypothetical protein
VPVLQGQWGVRDVKQKQWEGLHGLQLRLMCVCGLSNVCLSTYVLVERRVQGHLRLVLE